mmetsp:Transcript_52636/g.115413  ORF Transcript_52636/g.115413 Transcript_52636/m.115413 type:complete len:130 (-) Transcript_52636:159-548(-)
MLLRSSVCRASIRKTFNVHRVMGNASSQGAFVYHRNFDDFVPARNVVSVKKRGKASQGLLVGLSQRQAFRVVFGFAGGLATITLSVCAYLYFSQDTLESIARENERIMGWAPFNADIVPKQPAGQDTQM